MIHLAINSASASGTVIKSVTCEQCAAAYSYVMRRSFAVSHVNPLGLGAVNPGQIAAAAEVELQKMLDRDRDPVPCPNCGRFQVDMLARARGVIGKEFEPRLRRVGLMLVIAGSLAGSAALPLITEAPNQKLPFMTESGIVCAVLAAVLIPVGIWIVRRRNRMLREFDPNIADLRPARIALGQSRQREAREILAGLESESKREIVD